MPKSLVVVYDVAHLLDHEVLALAQEAAVMSEQSENHDAADVTIYESEEMTSGDVMAALAPDPPACVFCELEKDPKQHVYSNRAVFVVEDKNPKADLHLLVIPRAHYEHLANLPAVLVQAMHGMVGKIVEREELEDGYRLIVNQGAKGKQKIPHLHYHLLAGEEVLEDGFARSVG
jgi:histidine triad (HIT) family protein